MLQPLLGRSIKPYIAVRPVNHSGEKYFLGMWRDTDAVHSWSWPGCQGKNAQIEIYSIGTEVELFQNGESLGRKKLEFCKASYETIYQMGRLKAVSYDEKEIKLMRMNLFLQAMKQGFVWKRKKKF